MNNSELRKLVGGNIRHFRRQKGLTQEKLAATAKLTPQYIGRLERGKENVSIESLYRISKILKVPLHQLVTLDSHL
jgi:transcriptional regulator with XRE-family HTH domain